MHRIDGSGGRGELIFYGGRGASVAYAVLNGAIVRTSRPVAHPTHLNPPTMTTTVPTLAFLMNQTPMELFKHGGLVMWPVLTVSFLLFTVVIERVIFLIREKMLTDPSAPAKMLEKVKPDDLPGAIAVGKGSKDAVARVYTYAITPPRHDLPRGTRECRRKAPWVRGAALGAGDGGALYPGSGPLAGQCFHVCARGTPAGPAVLCLGQPG